MTELSCIDFSTGSLGQGLSAASGMAFAKPGVDVWAILGDGECQEGQIWEAAMLASRLGLSNLVAVVDCNGFQEFGYGAGGRGEQVEPVQCLAEKFVAFGWRVFSCSGHDCQELEYTLALAQKLKDGPVAVLANTTKGKGSNLLEIEPYRFHCTEVDNQEHAAILSSLR